MLFIYPFNLSYLFTFHKVFVEVFFGVMLYPCLPSIFFVSSRLY